MQQEADDSIAETGAFAEITQDRFILADRLLPRLRVYDARGEQIVAVGRFGEGPGEFRRIDAVAQRSDGIIVVVDQAQARLTILDENLAPDTVLRPEAQPFEAGVITVTRAFPRRD